MSKAEERAKQRALEAYPKMSRITEPHGVIPSDYESHYIGDANEEKRIGFVEGYRQAEKDLIENIHEKSWRLDEQLWSGFKDIEDASYQYIYDASNDWMIEIPVWNDVQEGFKAGAEWQKERMINKACEWLKEHATFMHPRKQRPVCMVNLNVFREAMEE